MKIKSVMKAIIIILGGITALIYIYMLIFKPIDIDSDNVTKIKVTISEYGEKEACYRIEFNDREKIDELVSEMNGIRARKVSETIKNGNYEEVRISIIIYSNKGSYGYDQIIIKGNGYISMREGTKQYKMSDRKGEKFYKYVKDLCITDENCKIRYKMLGPWLDYQSTEYVD